MLKSEILIAIAFAPAAYAHMSIWTPSMWGFNLASQNPISPNLPFFLWWWRGPLFRLDVPAPQQVTNLPAGGSVDFEIACNRAWTSYGATPTVQGSFLDACPGNLGAYHANRRADNPNYKYDPVAGPNATQNNPEEKWLSGCALGIADVEDIGQTTQNNLIIFSVQHDCVKQKNTSFEIPRQMPPCTGANCICGWFWLAQLGGGNSQMTAFRCNVTNVQADHASGYLPGENPEWCEDGCEKKPRVPIWAYDDPKNVAQFPGNPPGKRPAYTAQWGFPSGPQDWALNVTTTNTTVTANRPVTTTNTTITANRTVVTLV